MEEEVEDSAEEGAEVVEGSVVAVVEGTVVEVVEEGSAGAVEVALTDSKTTAPQNTLLVR